MLLWICNNTTRETWSRNVGMDCEAVLRTPGAFDDEIVCCARWNKALRRRSDIDWLTIPEVVEYSCLPRHHGERRRIKCNEPNDLNDYSNFSLTVSDLDLEYDSNDSNSVRIVVFGSSHWRRWDDAYGPCTSVAHLYRWIGSLCTESFSAGTSLFMPTIP